MKRKANTLHVVSEFVSATNKNMRRIELNYQDPLDLIWLHAAKEMGMTVVRDDSVFAAWDGKGTLTIGTPETLDPDDCLAQMILHETCHALVEGPDAWNKPDWGVQIDNREQRVREHACLRLQAALAHPYGLRSFFAATTNFRKYYDRLPEDPLTGEDDPATAIALDAISRATTGPLSGPLQEALKRTAGIAAVVQGVADPDSLWSQVAT